MKIGTIGTFSIYRTGDGAKKDDGSGFAWRCTCPRGEPTRFKLENDSARPVVCPNCGAEVLARSKHRCYPCSHLRSIFEAAKQRTTPERLKLTPEGEQAAAECQCISERGGHAEKEPEPEKEPEKEPGELGRNEPCWCGSGRRFKRCHGGGARPVAPLPASMPPVLAPPMVVPSTAAQLLYVAQLLEHPEERRRRISGSVPLDSILEEGAKQLGSRLVERAKVVATVPVVDKARARRERHAEAEERKIERWRRVDAILEVERAKDEARREKRRAREAARKAQASK